MLKKTLLFIFSAAIISFLFLSFREKKPENDVHDFSPAQERLKLGINLQGVSDWSVDFIWKDICPYMRIEGSGGEFKDSQFDENGYPLYLKPGQQINLGFGAGTNYVWPTGEYHIFWEGVGNIGARTTNEILIKDYGNGHQVWYIGHSNDWFGFSISSTEEGNHLRNLRIIMPGFEEDYLSSPLHPAFVEHWKNFEAFRFMDLQGTNNSQITEWSEMKGENFINQHSYDGHPLDRIKDSVSIGKMVELCNLMDKDAWFCMPHGATDSYIRNFAEYIRENLDSDLKVYVEYSNEVWNWGFPQTGYAADRGVALNIGDGGSLEYYVYRNGQIYKIWEDAFGIESDRLINVFSWQAVDMYWYKIAFDEYFPNPRFNPSGVMPEFYAIAPYFSKWDIPGSWRKDDIFSHVVSAKPSDYNLSYVRNLFKDRKKEADMRGLELGAYEAGQHYVDPVALSMEVNRDERIYNVYRQYINDWHSITGGLMMLYSSAFAPGDHGSWGLLERWNQDISTAPKYRAVMSFFD